MKICDWSKELNGSDGPSSSRVCSRRMLSGRRFQRPPAPLASGCKQAQPRSIRTATINIAAPNPLPNAEFMRALR